MEGSHGTDNKGNSTANPRGTGSELSRRELLKLALPRRRETPDIVRASCAGSMECGLCLGSCGAISARETRVEIDSLACTGCGACVMICPHHAINYSFTPESADTALATALDGNSPSRTIAFVCGACLPTGGTGEDAGTACHEGVALLPVPCHAATVPSLVLRALERGAAGVALVADCTRCDSVYSLEKMGKSIKFIRELMECLRISPERLRVIIPGPGREDMTSSLAEFAASINGLEELSPCTPGPSLLPADGLLLPALVRGLSARFGTGGEVVQGEEVPFGMVTMLASGCTGCGLCASRCPTEAISASRVEGKDSYRLLFEHARCTACGQCAGICPEGCLKMEHLLDTGRMAEPPVVLFNDDIARCRECGGIIGPAAMLNNLRKKLSAQGGGLAEHLSLCPSCRARHFRLGKVAGEGLTSAGR